MATYNETDLLIDGGIYYAAVDDGFEISVDRKKITVNLYDMPSPYIYRTNQVFYSFDNPTISNLVATGSDIAWYDFAIGGTAYRDSDPLVNGVTYYAAQSGGVCSSSIRRPVTVTILDEQAPTLIGCEKFRPQPGDQYLVSAWVREDGLQVNGSETRYFSEVKDDFINLLNHLKDKIFADDPKNRVIDNIYIPSPDTREFDVLVPFIKDPTSKNLTIYDFKYIKEKQSTTGLEKTVGFSFYLSSNKVYKFTYLTPFVRQQNDILDYRYPLLILDSNILSLDFTDVSIHSSNNYFFIRSDFRVNGGALSYSISDVVSDGSMISGLNPSVEVFDFVPDPDYQAMEYTNALLEITYMDAEGEEMQIQSTELTPQGEIIDGWQRMSADITIPLEAASMTISLTNNAEGDTNVYFDDLRFHPFDGNMKTFVYDPITQRLQAELDENNYATFYEYDKEGGLVRVKKETERGVYTIQETRSGNSKLNSIDLNE